jgi:hypothetical protein
MLNCLSGKQSSFEIGFGIFTQVSKQIRILQLVPKPIAHSRKQLKQILEPTKQFQTYRGTQKKRFISQACKPHSNSKTILEGKKQFLNLSESHKAPLTLPWNLHSSFSTIFEPTRHIETVPGTHKEISKLILDPQNQLSKQILPTKQIVIIKNSLH